MMGDAQIRDARACFRMDMSSFSCINMLLDHDKPESRSMNGACISSIPFLARHAQAVGGRL
jgi:hypothetical protein